MTCPKCQVALLQGVALEPIMAASGDDIGCDLVKLYPSGNARLVPCLKCPKCGWSVKEAKP